MRQPAQPLLIAVSAALLLGACAGPVAAPPPVAGLTARGPVVQRSLRTPTFALQNTTVERVAFTLDRLDHIEVFLQDLDERDGNGDPVPATSVGTLEPISDVLPFDREFPDVAIADLKPQRHYLVRLEAWQADPSQANAVVRVDDNAANGCETTFDTIDAAIEAADVVPVAGGFGLKLKDQTTKGFAAGALEVFNAAILDNEANTTISVEAD